VSPYSKDVNYVIFSSRKLYKMKTLISPLIALSKSASNCYRRTLCKARWSKFYRNEAWLKQAHQEEAARVEGSASMGLWKRQFKQNEAKLKARHGMFFMTSRVRIGEVIGMHWFEPRYRWLASRLNNGTDETMVYCPGRPAVGAESFICVPRQLEIMPDGRAMVELLPVAKCVLNELWEEAVPGEPQAPKLVCVATKELPLEGGGPPRGGLRFRGRSQSDGSAASSAADGGGGGVGGQDEAIADLLGGDNSAMTRFNGSATQLRIALLEILFAHGEANGIENVADLMEGERAAPRRLLELLSVLNDVDGEAEEDYEEEDEFEDIEEDEEDEDEEGGDGQNDAHAEASNS